MVVWPPPNTGFGQRGVLIAGDWLDRFFRPPYNRWARVHVLNKLGAQLYSQHISVLTPTLSRSDIIRYNLDWTEFALIYREQFRTVNR